MTIKEERDYFANAFSCERLSFNKQNVHLISKFKIGEHGKGLLSYLQENAWNDDVEGETAVYLIKEKATCQPVLFFSLKCGLLYDYGEFQELTEDEREFVRLLVEARQQKDSDSETNLLEAVESVFGELRKKTIIDIAIHKAEHELSGEEKATEQKVSNTYSAIELCHFCRNDGFTVPMELQTKLGFGLFWEQVMKKIEEIVSMIGSRYLYLFASDEELSAKKEEYRLINYYNTLGFKDIMDFKILKPSYDLGCYPMMQSIEDVLVLKRSIWERYEETY